MSDLVGTEGIPLYVQLKKIIRRLIETEQLKPGERIPSESELSGQYTMSRVTVRKAIADLVKEGLIFKIQGKGTFVKRLSMPNTSRDMISFTTLCHMQGLTPSSKVIEAKIVKAQKEEQLFFVLPSNSSVVMIKRLRYVNKFPVILETNYFHPTLSYLLTDRLDGSLYELLKVKYHINPCRGLSTISIHNLTEEESKTMDIPSGTVMLLNKCSVFDENGAPVHTVKQIVRVNLPKIFKYYI